MHKIDFRHIIKYNDSYHGIMILPVFSLSKPNTCNISRLVFDWGKSIGHPYANIAFAILDSPSNQFIKSIIYNDYEYIITSGISKCRSGRLSAYISKPEFVSHRSKTLINLLLEQEFKNKL